ncbi:hypothetical protein ABH940_005427 [Streptacidiphilus sp. BW17]|uniref:hypothetical protein n=1 Tax=Streptacidiphilus sp. BW17 TaxID=3156274 RepID=UPI0035160B59
MHSPRLPLADEGVEPAASFEITYRAARVAAAFDSPGVAQRLAGAFTASGAEVGPLSPAGTDPRVEFRTVSGLATLPQRSRMKVPHGGGYLTLPAGVTLLHDGPPRALVSVARPTITLTQLDAGAPHWPFLHYLLKYPLRRQVEAQGSVLAHSSAVEFGPDLACLFLGPSGAGKTTAFVELVTRGLRALGNDATLLSPSGDLGVEAAVWPHLVRIGGSTLARNTVLSSLPEDWCRRNPLDGKAEVFFDDLDQVFGRPIAAPPSQVAVVVDLGVDAAGEGLAVRRLDASEAHRVLQERLVEDRPQTGWLPGWSWQPSATPVLAIADRLASSTAMYQVRAGLASSRWADQLADWVRALHGPTHPTDTALPSAFPTAAPI